MSTTITSATDLIQAAELAAKKANAANTAAATASSATDDNGDALSSLTSNYNQFLSLLTAQLSHQDPTSPMQTDSFTSELAQFAGVEQQIKTNTNLTQLLSLNQDTAVSQSTSLVGRQAVVASTQIPLQNGTGELQLNPIAAGSTAIAITNSAGAVVRTQSLDVTAQTTDWKWDGKDDSGTALANGTYDVAVVAADGSAVPFNVIGTITGVTKNASNGVNVQMGGTTVDMSKVMSLLGTATASSGTQATS
ncbi:flagellar biosynthesis protein FlgD [Lichenicola cladoniae]|uniref:Basal-body rod modification protein FlgD n=1 Tax=Lichenicola cladoniae TaxID=1484109 RepID=A0A6M8HE84_9PROT|nr:flagellar hook capping FlgD N-terminal domain-containing protein [Lichenicola cladoniae]NPD69618.1 flagellar biosynthesis protein FlgD [Acetobacteraceae bacterium]QKE88730.1 flagellar biosynthesis protein FlgD [Lichenicola cladoniae]